MIVSEEDISIINEEQNMEDTSNLFLLLGNVTRIKIIYALRNENKTVSDLAHITNCSQSLISKQLKILRDKDIVDFKQKSKYRQYYLTDKNIISALNELVINMLI
ncbi:ArsR/SmtB family transcription factor [Terrisporobacter sp.]|uniref:ArsR/SmtB family transcription factor n=1 Tax=Terrisporobacter sp. TaxID=1965305 RepID=UPI00262DB59A|nr:metalloregulator ArsR/SmtB family transcription factor [Terrisporobacter sp.]